MIRSWGLVPIVSATLCAALAQAQRGDPVEQNSKSEADSARWIAGAWCAPTGPQTRQVFEIDSSGGIHYRNFINGKLNTEGWGRISGDEETVTIDYLVKGNIVQEGIRHRIKKISGDEADFYLTIRPNPEAGPSRNLRCP
jgi:hypothetical protein